MYTPSHFKQEDLAVLHEAMERIGFVSLVTSTSEGLLATQAPVLLDREGGILRGHIARANLQWKLAMPDARALAIFSGPNGYISPNWYATKREHGRVVPTWNYIAIHAHGHVRFSEDRDLLLDIVTRLTDKHEARSEQPWRVSDAPAEYVESMLKAIVAFEFHITRLEANWKLSQNRSEEDREGTIEGLSERNELIAEEMRSYYRKPD